MAKRPMTAAFIVWADETSLRILFLSLFVAIDIMERETLYLENVIG